MVVGAVGFLASMSLLQPESLKSKFEKTREGMTLQEIEGVFATIELDYDVNGRKCWGDREVELACYVFDSEGKVVHRELINRANPWKMLCRWCRLK
jgi:hypothetical protein